MIEIQVSEIPKTKLEWFNAWAQVENDFLEVGQRFAEFYKSASLQIYDWNIKILRSNITALYVNRLEPLDSEAKIMLCNIHDIEALDKIEKYSMYNPFVHMKFASRDINKLLKEQGRYREFFRGVLKRIKELELNSFEVAKKREQMKFESYLGLKYRVLKVLEWNLKENVELYKYLPIMFGQQKMSKNNFLSLLSLNKDLKHWDGEPNRTMKYIAELPEEIDYRVFQEAVFIKNFETTQDNVFFDVFLREVLDSVDRKEFDTFKVLSDITGKPLQTYTATTDVYGDIVTITPNKPKLELVKEGE